MADPRLPCSRLPAAQPGHHPGHPTAVGGLPSSEPGLDAGAHDRPRAYLTAVPGRQPVLV